MLAIGFKKRHILSLFVFEGFFLGLLGGIIGVIVAITIVLILNRIGIPFYTPGSTGISFIVRPDMDFGIILLALSFSIIAAVANAYISITSSQEILKTIQALPPPTLPPGE